MSIIDIEDMIEKKKINHTLLFRSYSKTQIDPFVRDLVNKNFQSNSEINKELDILKRKYNLSPKKAEIRFIYNYLLKNNHIKQNLSIDKFIKAKESRGLSGVIVISLITSPYPEYTDKNGKKKTQNFSCKFDCHFCPKETDKNGRMINPRSYLSDEPTVQRGLQNNFDAVSQFNDRGFQYLINSHPVDKIEIIILGGTWTSYPREYQETFIRDTFYAANTFYDLEKRERKSLTEEQLINENSYSRIIGLTLEMRPDSISNEEIVWLRYLGCTRVQLGVQHTDDKILKKINRKCYLIHTKKALKLLLNSCFKVDAHWMPDLPGTTPEKDRQMFDDIIDSNDLQFDQWKIYPTSVTPWTKIKKWYDNGEYTPYTDKDPSLLIDILIHVKKKLPTWIRINRLVRDIPNTAQDGTVYIHGGNKVTNLRQLIHNKLKSLDLFCPCIRCREVKKNTNLLNYARIVIKTYLSSGGTEYFISMESGNSRESKFINHKWYNNGKNEPGIIYGFARLRLPTEFNEKIPELNGCSFLRELHVYGQVISDKNKNNVQHKGIGKKLLKMAEQISYKNKYYKIAIISGIGVRKYYKKLGYNLSNTYMIKLLSNRYYYLKYIFIIILLLIIIYT